MFLNCEENFTNADCRFNAILADLSLVKSGWSSLCIKVMLVIEIVAILGGLIFSTISIIVFIQRSSLHVNFARIVIVFTSQFYILACSRIVLMLFQTGILVKEAHQTTLLFASVAHIQECGSCMNLFFGFIIERLFSTIYISDYEKRKRSQISTIIIAISISESLVFSIALTSGMVQNILHSILMFAGIMLVMILTGVVISILIYRWNKSHLYIAQSTIAYSLSTKFQLTENFSVFRTLLFVAIISSFASTLGCISLNIFIYFDGKDANISAIFGQVFDLSHTIVMASQNVTFVLTQPTWKRDFQVKLNRWFKIVPAPTEINVIQVQEAGESYFNDLIGSWDNQLAANRKIEIRNR